MDDTDDQTWSRAGSGDSDLPPIPGLLKVFSGGVPCFEPHPIESRPLVIGRGQDCDLVIDDARLSRRHAEVAFDGEWRVRDLDSRNGTFVDADRLKSQGSLLSVGDTLLMLCRDVRLFLGQKVDVVNGIVIGPRLAAVRAQIALAARSAEVLHVTGQTGTGKELAARWFHEKGPRPKGPFVAVNCAAVPVPLAESLFFGSRRGVYSGADKDAEGYLGTADGGTLFLDEVAELPMEVQSKLLRVMETREVQPLGASQPRQLDLRICSATNAPLDESVAAGEFRQDLYFRLAQPLVKVPSLSERCEEIPWIIQSVLKGKTAHVTLVEACLLRPWPGNVRELIKTLSAAALRAEGAQVLGEHLPGTVPSSSSVKKAAPGDDEIREAMRNAEGNIARAARALGMHRTQLKRRLSRMD